MLDFNKCFQSQKWHTVKFFSDLGERRIIYIFLNYNNFFKYFSAYDKNVVTQLQLYEVFLF